MADRHDDVEALRDLAARYAHYVDTHCADQLAEVFAEHAVWDATATGFGRHIGRDAIVTLMRSSEAHVAASMHCVANHLVDRVEGDEAEGTHYLFGERRLRDGTVVPFRSLVHDRCVRTADGWRIHERIMAPLMEGGSTR